MLAAARADGVALRPGDCYRPANEQSAAKSNSCARGNCACAAGSGTSMHGWGEAVDFRDAAGSLTFGSSGYRWLKANGARFGWNHPRWAEPGGSACPEAWHWEWVGDGGRMRLDELRADAVGILASSDRWLLGDHRSRRRRRPGRGDRRRIAGFEAVELADQGRRSGAVRPGLLAGGVRRRNLQLR